MDTHEPLDITQLISNLSLSNADEILKEFNRLTEQFKTKDTQGICSFFEVNFFNEINKIITSKDTVDTQLTNLKNAFNVRKKTGISVAPQVFIQYLDETEKLLIGNINQQEKTPQFIPTETIYSIPAATKTSTPYLTLYPKNDTSNASLPRNTLSHYPQQKTTASTTIYPQVYQPTILPDNYPNTNTYKTAAVNSYYSNMDTLKTKSIFSNHSNMFCENLSALEKINRNDQLRTKLNAYTQELLEDTYWLREANNIFKTFSNCDRKKLINYLGTSIIKYADSVEVMVNTLTTKNNIAPKLKATLQTDALKKVDKLITKQPINQENYEKNRDLIYTKIIEINEKVCKVFNAYTDLGKLLNSDPSLREQLKTHDRDFEGVDKDLLREIDPQKYEKKFQSKLFDMHFMTNN